MPQANPRIAILGFAIECNRFSPVSTAADFAQDVDIRGERIVEEARSGASITLPDLPGFFSEMDRTGPWMPVPLRVALAQPGGPVQQEFFDEFHAEIEAGLRAALPLDGVFISSHGAALCTENDDPDGELFASVRAIVGPEVPVIAVLDLHANVSEAMVKNLSVFVGYLRNPHTDIHDRGIEAARHMRELLEGGKTAIAMAKLPLVPPSIALLTADGPYGEMIAYGQERVGGDIMNVSVMAGFAFSDTPKNGYSAVVTARNANAGAARALALDICRRTWKMRTRFRKPMTGLADAIAMAGAAGRDMTLPSVLLADVADNPGGGGRGNTTYILRALVEARVTGALLAVFNDPPLAAMAHRLGVGAEFQARFNTGETNAFSQPFEARAQVTFLHDGPFVGRRGVLKGVSGDLGPSCWLQIAGVGVVVISNRQQCMDPSQIEALGVDIGRLRCLVVKSRGHFRAGFDEYFAGERIIEVDCPGLTSPALHNFAWTRLPRPVYPLDEHAIWREPSG
ncbi:MAG: M81 family metallopeptidase [Alphaproteobacteria bacterium]|nr:M81 family metallopeptidase [Alphaproteobacteria bacterium]